jgi:hypothetical protein
VTPTWEDAEQILHHMAAHRAVASTDLNAFSSRSHCVFSIVVEGRHRVSGNVYDLF